MDWKNKQTIVLLEYYIIIAVDVIILFIINMNQLKIIVRIIVLVMINRQRQEIKHDLLLISICIFWWGKNNQRFTSVN